MAQRHSVDDYLETIWFLAFPIGEYRPSQGGNPALASRVAEMLGVSRASAGRDAEADGGRRARPARRAQGGDPHADRPRARRAVVRKHRIIERLLTDFMGYTAAEAHVHADELGDTFSDEMIERMEEKLGHPERCPHGWPVDTELEQRENRELVAALRPRRGRPRDDRPARRARRRAPALVLRRGARAGHEGRGARQPEAGQLTVKTNGGERDDRRPRRVGPLRQAVVGAARSRRPRARRPRGARRPCPCAPT